MHPDDAADELALQNYRNPFQQARDEARYLHPARSDQDLIDLLTARGFWVVACRCLDRCPSTDAVRGSSLLLCGAFQEGEKDRAVDLAIALTGDGEDDEVAYELLAPAGYEPPVVPAGPVPEDDGLPF